MRDEAERLNNDIQNLLDATRISREQVRPRQEWIEPQDIVNSALERRRRRLASHSIALDMDSNLPFIYVDPVLVEQAFVQIVDNAAKYSPTGSTIIVAAKRNGHDVVLSVQRHRRRPDGGGERAARRAFLPRAAPRGHDVRLGPRPVDRQSLRRRQWRQDPGGQSGRRSRHHGVDSSAASQRPTAQPEVGPDD